MQTHPHRREFARHQGRTFGHRGCRPHTPQPGQARRAHALVQGFKALQRDDDIAINGRPRGLEHAHHGERLIGVIGGQTIRAAMGQHQTVTHRQTVARGHLGTQHRFDHRTCIGLGVGKGPALGPLQARTLGLKHLKQLGRGAQHRKAPVGIAQLNRHRPAHLGQGAQCHIGLVRHVAARPTHLEHAVEHQFAGAAAWAHNQIHTAEGLGETLARIVAQLLHPQQNQHRHRHRQRHHGQRMPTRPCAAPCQTPPQAHGAPQAVRVCT